MVLCIALRKCLACLYLMISPQICLLYALDVVENIRLIIVLGFVLLLYLRSEILGVLGFVVYCEQKSAVVAGSAADPPSQK